MGEYKEELQQERLKQAQYKTQQERAKMWRERFVSIGAVAGMASAMVTTWLYFTKADAKEVKEEAKRTELALGTVGRNIQAQHNQSEKLRKTVEGTTKAVKAVASSVTSSNVIPISSTPVDGGCWTIYGGIVRCSTDVKRKKPVKVEVPKPPAPMPSPEPLDFLR